MGHSSAVKAVSKRSLRVGALIAACVLGWACVSSSPAQPASTSRSEPLADADTHAYRQCKVDDDCVYATNGCCDCANGGSDIAVRRDQLDAFRARFSCEVACTEVGALPACGSGQTKCEAGLCTYTVAADNAQ